ncbi:uncharacterized protein LOC110093930 [Dendrobium catenatum]|uniref:uncharacterized protein LOC110093930 n=1 Tax=Dendrobium catenatum TaxID=906689 RepID=UPI0009F61F4E|nr:uncharacterized protein LOC110093930 [Dendrobium catenatum]
MASPGNPNWLLECPLIEDFTVPPENEFIWTPQGFNDALSNGSFCFKMDRSNPFRRVKTIIGCMKFFMRVFKAYRGDTTGIFVLVSFIFAKEFLTYQLLLSLEINSF